jgi:transposase-like protein
MKHRKWDPKVKAQIVLEGLKGVTVSELCNRHQISQNQYYQWRDQFLRNLEKPFETGQVSKREQALKEEVRRLKTIVGDLTVELKKSDYEL